MNRNRSDADQAAVIEKVEVARELAKRYYQLEPGITQIFRYTDRAEAEAHPAEPIKLLEVNAATIPSGVLPLHFGPMPASGIPYPSIIIEVTPDEFRRIQAQELRLPERWHRGEELPRPEVA